MTVRCPCCLRSEERTGGQTIVLRSGGARRPVDPARDAWAVVAQSLAGTLGPIAGPCPGCGQPLVGDPGLAPAAYRLPLGEVELTVGADHTLRGPAGVLTVAEAEALVDAVAPRARRAPLLGAVQATMLALMVVPFLVWALAIVVVVAFLSRADTAF